MRGNKEGERPHDYKVCFKKIGQGPQLYAGLELRHVSSRLNHRCMGLPLNYLRVVLVLALAHALGDLAFQTSWVATYKNPHSVYLGAGYPQIVWPIVLLGHAMVNGAVYYLFTGSLLIALLETSGHFLVDLGSGYGLYGLFWDQFLHGVCILIWALIIRAKSQL